MIWAKGHVPWISRGLLWTIVFLGVLHSQDRLRQKTQAINVEVPVRVFEGGKFVSGLTAGDFEILENGISQEVLACYCIEAGAKDALPGLTPEGQNPPSPVLSRSFIMILEVDSFGKGLRDTMDYIIGQALQRDDTLFIATPLRTYRLGPESPSRRNPMALMKALKNRIADDIQKASGELRFLLSDYLSLAEREEGEFAAARQIAIDDVLRRIRELKTVDEPRLAEIAKAFSTIPGQKHVFLFLEKDDILTKRASTSGLDQAAAELFKMELMRDVRFDVDRLTRIFSQNHLDFNFIFITNSEALETSLDVHPSRWGDFMKLDITGQFFSVFSRIARMTGGLTISSQNPRAATQRAVEIADKYYLLYYQPENTAMDGTFREISVRVKGRVYSIFHRRGYLAVDEDRLTED